MAGGVDWSTAFEDTADDLRFVGNDADELNRQYDIVRPLIPREWASDSPLFDGLAGVRRAVYRQGVSHELADSLDAAVAPDDGEPSPDETALGHDV